MNANEIVDTGQLMARIGELRVVRPHLIEITWAEGARAGYREQVDLSPAIYSYKIYRPLRDDEALFATAKLRDSGDIIVWDGDDLEMTAEMVETLAEETMTPAEFAAFLKRNNLTQEEAAALLGRSRRQIGYYLNPGPIPRVISLACLGYETLVSLRKDRAA
ncbi:hypothetical protein [Pseudorhodoplanes sinuspersici]|uniref:Uncharacterized protein n=1 Tax=Pseudorhodoplanes sinuspersici TaxID=1235591 RepID=A0A1W6ZUY3_9HYPH|nr:hypothetical protein [Pseudorhodoplanes sinuspersici]ARQ00931.1 hypothetical protein CAK95_18920 [Pseudorhodoplanes sinuspersici]RKE72561.1 hypothetical protein DFP91_0429 [Pseudorhodoplanes sinuspersici]